MTLDEMDVQQEKIGLTNVRIASLTCERAWDISCTSAFPNAGGAVFYRKPKKPQKWALIGINADQIFEKLDEEVAELRDAINKGQKGNAAEEIPRRSAVRRNEPARHLDVTFGC